MTNPRSWPLQLRSKLLTMHLKILYYGGFSLPKKIHLQGTNIGAFRLRQYHDTVPDLAAFCSVLWIVNALTRKEVTCSPWVSKNFLQPMGPRKLWSTPTNAHCWSIVIHVGPVLHPAIVWRDNPSVVTSHPGTQRMQEFLLTQGDLTHNQAETMGKYNVSNMDHWFGVTNEPLLFSTHKWLKSHTL